MAKNPRCHAGDVRDMGSIPGWGRSPRGGYGSPLFLLAESPWTDGAGGLQPTGWQNQTRLERRSRHTHTCETACAVTDV